jgi:protein SCO1
VLRGAIGVTLCAAVMMIGVAGCGQSIQSNQNANQSSIGTASAPSSDAPLNWSVPTFKGIDETGKPFNSSMLKGHVWIADVFYSTCPTVCPPIANNMAHLQKQLKKDGLDVQIVSFSVDPQSERPDTLMKFGKEHGANFSNWHFLTGYSFKWIQQFSSDAFKESISQTGSKYYSHTVNWYLVDKSGKITQFFDGLQPPYDKIVQAVKSQE